MSFARRLKRQQQALSHGGRGRRAARRGAACGVAMATVIGAMAPAIASVGEGELELDLEGVQVLSNAELDESRGGFSIGAFKLDIGLKITTTINNTWSLQSVLSLNAKNKAAEITSNIFKGGYTPGAGAGADGAQTAAAAAAAAKAGALGVAIPQIQIATKVPQVVIGAVAGDSSSNNSSSGNSGSFGSSGSGGSGNAQQNNTSAPNSQDLPIPIAGEIIQQIQDAVEPTVGNPVPSQTGPVQPPAPHEVVTTPQELADVILDGVPSAQEASDIGNNLVQGVIDALGDNGGAATAAAAPAPDVNQIVDNAGTQPPSAEQLAQIVTEAGPQDQTQSAPELALNDVELLPEVIMTALAGGTKFNLGDTQVTHQIQNGVLASIQNMASGISIQNTVEMSVNIANFNSIIQGALSSARAAALGAEIAKFSSTIGN